MDLRHLSAKIPINIELLTSEDFPLLKLKECENLKQHNEEQELTKETLK